MREAVLFHCSINKKGFGKVELYYGKTKNSSKTNLQMICVLFSIDKKKKKLNRTECDRISLAK